MTTFSLMMAASLGLGQYHFGSISEDGKSWNDNKYVRWTGGSRIFKTGHTITTLPLKTAAVCGLTAPQNTTTAQPQNTCTIANY